jgi:hypothetical protein
MATATFSISNQIEGESWSQIMQGFTLGNIISSPTTYLTDSNQTPVKLLNVTYPSIDIESIYSSNEGGEPYFTWREYNWNRSSSTREYGHSLDLWSSDLYTDIVTNNITWGQINNRTYNLSNNKYSLVYFYTYSTQNKTRAYPIYWSRGGILTVTVVQ